MPLVPYRTAPGRFDRKLYIDLPNLEDREKLFQYYLSKMQYDAKLDVGRLGVPLHGFVL
jgi:SpoVK/Ycf46/Vps4 family AAA+-type ATPase